MICHCFYLAIFLLVLAGCSPLPVGDDEINWKFIILSKQGCPDLSGRYVNDGIRREEMMRCTSTSLTCSRAAGLFPLLIGKFEDLPEYRFEKYTALPKQKKNDVGAGYVTMIRHTPSGITARLQDTQGTEYSSLSTTLLLRPDEVLSGILNTPILEVAHNALRILLQHHHMSAGCVA